MTIVVVDDDMDYRLIVRALLRPLPDVIVAGEAADGEEARDLLRRTRPDVLITDLVMPRLNGMELTAWVRTELPDTRIILMSSFTEDAYRMMASDSGADAFVHKQVLTTSLLPAILDLIRRRLSGGSGPIPPSTGGSHDGPSAIDSIPLGDTIRW